MLTFITGRICLVNSVWKTLLRTMWMVKLKLLVLCPTKFKYSDHILKEYCYFFPKTSPQNVKRISIKLKVSKTDPACWYIQKPMLVNQAWVLGLHFIVTLASHLLSMFRVFKCPFSKLLRDIMLLKALVLIFWHWNPQFQCFCHMLFVNIFVIC